ncbi:tetratricopeptide repeat protein [Simiduia sp. 21SJ11W-1]|uniref:tetratricopeptide repeat protein n=1 Tax=Simiduia sp. 21SJ11W-1 TaxID=2909669 RepID=UPI00209F4C16|nr:tetratricopeptide repeat protein [Simiduia sp. 21SJ11W-1]UTA48738.1 tetratricopeptide repeat protein [Simiduia sp. 21SJ11W-1]
MPFFILAIFIQVLLVVHVIKTGRDSTWIWVLLMAPLIGGLAYLIVELLPGLRRSSGAQKLAKKVRDTTDPNRNLRTAHNNLRKNGTVQNLITMAEECMEKGLFEEAAGFYQRALTGQYQQDPNILEGLARAQFGAGHYDQARTTLESLINANPDYRSKIGHVLYARSLYALGEFDDAFKEFSALNAYHATALVKYHLGELLMQQHRPTDALAAFRSAVEEENDWDPTGTPDKPWQDKARARIQNLTTH